MTEHPANGLDDVVHQRVRLGILAIAQEARRAEFSFLRATLQLTGGNLGQHLAVLEKAGAWLTGQIRRVFEANWRAYGARRITRALRRKGIKASHGTVERLMRAAGLRGVKRGRGRRTTMVDPSAPRPSDLVNRQFSASRPDQLWVADLTYVATAAGWVYVALVTDVFSRAIIGWQVADHLRTELPLERCRWPSWPGSAVSTVASIVDRWSRNRLMGKGSIVV